MMVRRSAIFILTFTFLFFRIGLRLETAPFCHFILQCCDLLVSRRQPSVTMSGRSYASAPSSTTALLP